MRLLLCIVLLPSFCVAKVQNIVCPDGNECPIGKICCGVLGGPYKCCDLPEEHLMNKKLTAGVSAHPTFNQSNAVPGVQSAYASCPTGTTRCGPYCCEYSNGDCCLNQYNCCAEGFRCCQKSYDGTPWCCRKRDRCHQTQGYCIAGASSVSVAILTILSAFVLATMSKYFQ